MAEELLDDPQVSPAFEEVRRGAVPQAVRPDVGRAGHRGDGLMHHRASLANVEPTAPRAQQQRRTRLVIRQGGAAVGEPRVECLDRKSVV